MIGPTRQMRSVMRDNEQKLRKYSGIFIEFNRRAMRGNREFPNPPFKPIDQEKCHVREKPHHQLRPFRLEVSCRSNDRSWRSQLETVTQGLNSAACDGKYTLAMKQ